MLEALASGRTDTAELAEMAADGCVASGPRSVLRLIEAHQCTVLCSEPQLRLTMRSPSDGQYWSDDDTKRSAAARPARGALEGLAVRRALSMLIASIARARCGSELITTSISVTGTGTQRTAEGRHRACENARPVNRNLYLVFGGIFCIWATQTAAFMLIPLAAADLGLSGRLIGVLVATPAGLGLATDVLVAAISDRVGRRGPMVLGSLLGVLAGAVLAFGSGFATLFVGVVAVGLSMSLSVGPALAYVTEACFPKDAARVQGYNGAVQGLSALASAVVVGSAVDNYGAQRSAWIIALLMATALIIFMLLRESVTRSAIRRSPRELAGSYAAVIRMLLGRTQLQLAALVSLIYTSVVFVLGNAFLPIYIVRDLGQSAVLVGILLATRNIGMTLSSPFFGNAFVRFGLVRSVVGANSVAILGVFGMAFVPTDRQLLFVAMALQGVGVGFATAASNTLVTSATARPERAMGFAANSLVHRGGSFVSPLLFGAILDISGIQTVFVAGGVLGATYLLAMIARARAAELPCFVDTSSLRSRERN